jgi:hypothetical protein
VIRPGAGAHAGEASLGPFALAALFTSVGFLVAGVVVPGAAAALLRGLVVVLALGYVVARAHGAVAATGLAHDRYSPFADEPAGPKARSRSPMIEQLTAELASADRPRKARRTEIPRRVRWRLMDEAERRLADHHGLRLADPRDHARIRTLVGGATWSLLEAGLTPPGGGRADPGTTGLRSRAIPVSRVPSILDDLERL